MATHVVAFALDIGFGALIAGNLLALMGVMGLLGVLVSGFLADRIGPARPTLLCFAMRIGIFVLVILSQSKPAVMMFALLYGFTFLMTAPLTVYLLGEHLWVGAAGADQRNDIDDPPDQRGHRGVGRGTGVRHLGQLRPGLSADVDPVRSSNGRDAPGS